MELIDQYIARLLAAASSEFVLRHAGQRTKCAGLYTGRFKAVFHPDIASVTFDHFSVGLAVARCAEGAGHGTAFAADTVGIVVDGESRFRILAQAPHRAGWNARRIHAMHTCCGNICIVNTAVFQFHFIVIRFAEALIARHNICVVLVYTRSFEQEESHGLHT